MSPPGPWVVTGPNWGAPLGVPTLKAAVLVVRQRLHAGPRCGLYCDVSQDGARLSYYRAADQRAQRRVTVTRQAPEKEPT